ncbi:MAG: hypothetical protein HZA22_10860 [Nitrospirae bacterium]|nr:hypothetical protein [Nitrospirota bacterium]MBI5696144.1 hypothetical protein [Nitrospirota bacterium]
MLSPEDKSAVARHRAALTEWLAGDRSEPFVVPRSERYCVCETIFTGHGPDLVIGIRLVVMWFVNAVPLSSVKVSLLRLLGARIGRDVYISPETYIDPLYPQLIELEDGVLLGIGSRVMTHEYSVKEFRLGRVRIGKHSVLGGFSTVRCGVTIGERANVGFNSFVNRDVPDDDSVGGVPAKSLKGKD